MIIYKYMADLVSAPTLLYLSVAAATLAITYEVLKLISTLTYKVVVIFIALIILSNCAAKLYGRLILKENI